MNKTTPKLNKFYAVIALLVTQGVFAANFNISPYGTLPTTVTTGQSVSAYFTVTNMTNTARNGYVVQGLPTTVTQNTTSPKCTNPINLGPNANCQLQLDITGAVSANFAICKGNSCTTATTPLSVSLNTTPPATPPRFAYVTQEGGSPQIQVCPVDAQTGLIAESDCTDADSTSSLPSINAQGIVVNSTGTIAYISGETETAYAYQCPIDRDTGLFSSGCTSTNITSPSGYDPYYGLLTLSPDNSHVYLSDYNDGNGLRILSCPITGGVISSTCSINGDGIIVNANNAYGAGIVVNKNNSLGYAGLYNDSIGVAVCSINNNVWNTASTSPACQYVNGDGTITLGDTAGLAFNPDQSILYIASTTSPVVYGCNPTLNGSNFSHCFVASTDIDYTWGVTINSQNTFAYVTDYSNTVYVCPINQQDGTFGTCTPITGFSATVNVALLY
ncbi:MAG: hypothetical protein ACHP65_06655 [Legionellales bacterium]